MSRCPDAVGDRGRGHASACVPRPVLRRRRPPGHPACAGGRSRAGSRQRLRRPTPRPPPRPPKPGALRSGRGAGGPATRAAPGRPPAPAGTAGAGPSGRKKPAAGEGGPEDLRRGAQRLLRQQAGAGGAQAVRLHRVTPPTDENYAWAQFFLAKCAHRPRPAPRRRRCTWRSIARERSNPQVLPKALEELQVLTDLPHDEVMIDEQVFGALDLGLPPEGQRLRAYQQGLVDLRVGNERWATTHFGKLPEGSAEASRAKYAMLVTRLGPPRRFPKRGRPVPRAVARTRS